MLAIAPAAHAARALFHVRCSPRSSLPLVGRGRGGGAGRRSARGEAAQPPLQPLPHKERGPPTHVSISPYLDRFRHVRGPVQAGHALASPSAAGGKRPPASPPFPIFSSFRKIDATPAYGGGNPLNLFGEFLFLLFPRFARFRNYPASLNLVQKAIPSPQPRCPIASQAVEISWIMSRAAVTCFASPSRPAAMMSRRASR